MTSGSVAGSRGGAVVAAGGAGEATADARESAQPETATGQQRLAAQRARARVRVSSQEVRRGLAASIAFDKHMASSAAGDQGVKQLEKQQQKRKSTMIRAGLLPREARAGNALIMGDSSKSSSKKRAKAGASLPSAALQRPRTSGGVMDAERAERTGGFGGSAFVGQERGRHHGGGGGFERWGGTVLPHAYVACVAGSSSGGDVGSDGEEQAAWASASAKLAAQRQTLADMKVRICRWPSMLLLLLLLLLLTRSCPRALLSRTMNDAGYLAQAERASLTDTMGQLSIVAAQGPAFASEPSPHLQLFRKPRSPQLPTVRAHATHRLSQQPAEGGAPESMAQSKGGWRM